VEDWLTESRRGAPAIAALAAIGVITALWWALALWPLTVEAPQWLARTRYVCFGATIDGLPDAGGWILLIGQPLGMLLLLLVVWGDEVRVGMRRVLARTAGQIAVGITSAAIIAGLASVIVHVRDASASPFIADPLEKLGGQLTRISDVPPAVSLIDQFGDTVSLDRYRGRAVLVTFAFAHCQTVCPVAVNEVLSVRDKLAARDAGRTPAVLVITLDPLRDTPTRLPTIAKRWGMSGDAHVLSGEVEEVERTLNRWRIPRVRNERTGDLSHPAMVYVLGPDGRIAYLVNGGTELILAAIRAL
jgi:cytochrome oxidase Cu insertion factor (SCO1/SenC/PrrC family)